ncbi:cytochrome c peroxidase, partial [Thiolapillus sp.]|uniref:cytochrome c peroxidase n=1 Tax=Thiolapillus sp. TaxID=2017437 RepID=UPI003AF97CD9
MPAVSLQAARVIEPIQTVSEPLGLDPGIVALGDRLFHDLRLSRNNTVSCAHCHRLNAGGDDDMRCQPWRAKRRLVDPSSREAALFSRRALRQRENKVGLRTR